MLVAVHWEQELDEENIVPSLLVVFPPYVKATLGLRKEYWQSR